MRAESRRRSKPKTWKPPPDKTAVDVVRGEGEGEEGGGPRRDMVEEVRWGFNVSIVLRAIATA